MTQMSKRRGRGATCCEGLSSVLSPTLFKALCDPNRLAILVRLAESCAPSTVSEIAECCPVNLSVVSRHLAQLREAGVLSAERRGKQVYYSARAEELVRTLRAIADALERCCGRAAASGGRSAHSAGTAKEGTSR
jgi:DNA-binding transcriptional ArsR family regulator